MSRPVGDSGGVPPAFSGPERRRHPRAASGEGVLVTIPVVINAEVLDISSGGALLSASDPLKIGERGHLRMLLDREPFNARVEVCRVHPGTVTGREMRHRIGVTFTAMDDASRKTLQRFVRDDSKGS